MLSFCVNCGRPYEASEKFCNSCGKPLPRPMVEVPSSIVVQTAQTLPQSPASPAEASESDVSVEIVEAPVKPPHSEVLSSSIPFARFTLLGGLAIVCCSTIGFVILDDVFRRKAYLLPFAFLVGVVLVICLRQAFLVWASIGTYGDHDSLPIRLRRTLVRRLAIFATLASCGGMLLGAQVGISGEETESYIVDLAMYEHIGQNISDTRNGAEATIEAQLAMYQRIEPNVVALKPVVDRLKSENQVYAARYPAAHATTAASAENFVLTGKRDELLMQQIAVAKEIREVQGHDAQLAMYREKMMPVLAEEDHLDGR